MEITETTINNYNKSLKTLCDMNNILGKTGNILEKEFPKVENRQLVELLKYRK